MLLALLLKRASGKLNTDVLEENETDFIEAVAIFQPGRNNNASFNTQEFFVCLNLLLEIN